ncbi:MAG: right-handed parallel beta-helix repeat-containing protein, partial [Acidobacteria bacterium ACB2]|nr:right-handed parallel beta-helix repeat-containing protein [Acidobacteria bacterium ACB2]
MRRSTALVAATLAGFLCAAGEVSFALNTALTVNGKLTAIGTSGSPITFTSNAASPAPGNWAGVNFSSGADATSRLSYVNVSYTGNYGNAGGVVIAGGSPAHDHVTVTSSSTAGIAVTGGTPTLDAVSVSGVTTDGIYVSGTSTTPTVTNSTLSGNSRYGINLVNGGGLNVSGTALTGNTNYAVGAEANTRLLSATGLTVSGNGGGTKNAIGYRGGNITSHETWRLFSGLPWEVTANPTVNATWSLTVEPG